MRQALEVPMLNKGISITNIAFETFQIRPISAAAAVGM